MPLPRDVLDRALLELNGPFQEAERLSVVSYEPHRFVLRVPPALTLPAEACIDERFSAIQYVLHFRDKVTTAIQGAEWQEDDHAYHVHYDVVEWD
ncbi:MAG TPA: hypothetical protein VNZ52_14665 [Candidatus Thermoplasmatota archaeon]|nr:hypothetical protein [Candidatus Thermoplasmatota archaeon]